MNTIFGGKGFIGSNIIKKLKEKKLEFYIPEKNDKSVYGKDLGYVIYCAGLSSDFRNRPFDTVEAHVSYLSEILKRSNFKSLVYISSTRVYLNSNYAQEEMNLSVNPNISEDIFNISKLMGESLCLNSMKQNVKIVRLSNVCGNDFSSNNFLYSIIKDAVEKKEIILKTTLDSEKDYIGINDAAEMIINICDKGKNTIYNVAGGRNTSHEVIINILKEITNCRVKVCENASTVKFPKIDISRIRKEFNFKPAEASDLIRNLTYKYISEKR